MHLLEGMIDQDYFGALNIIIDQILVELEINMWKVCDKTERHLYQFSEYFVFSYQYCFLQIKYVIILDC